jgi:hypothetical protein
MDVSMALWCVRKGHRPSVAEGMLKIATLAANGPSPEAFTFKSPFPTPTGGEAERH